MQHQQQSSRQTSRTPSGSPSRSQGPSAADDFNGPALNEAFGTQNLDALTAALAGHPGKAYTFISSGSADFTWKQLLDLLRSRRESLTATQRQQLALFQRGVRRPDTTPQLFEAVYGVTLADKGATDTRSSTESAVVFDQLAKLPVGHVVAGDHYSRVETAGGNQSNFLGETVRMGRYQRTRKVFEDNRDEYAQRGIERPIQLYAKTVRHEIGHAIDERLNADRSLAQRCGWTIYGPDAVDDWLRQIDAWTGADARPEFEASAREMLATVMGGKSPGVSTAFDGRIQALEEAQPGFADWLAATALGKVLDGSRNPKAFADRPTLGGGMTWLSTNLQSAYILDATASAQLTGWGNGAASVTDKEWVAELYAEWYATPDSPGSSKLAEAFPAEVQKFMRGPVAAYDG